MSTDDYTRGIMSSAPRKPNSNRMDQDNDLAQRSLGDGLLSTEPKHPNTCSRVIVVLLSFLMFAAGIALLVFAVLVRKNKEPLPICVQCDKYTMIGIIVGA